MVLEQREKLNVGQFNMRRKKQNNVSVTAVSIVFRQMWKKKAWKRRDKSKDLQ